MLKLTGALTAIVTPFTDHGEVDEEAFRALVSWQIEEGIDGLVVCGTTGESATLSKEEKIRLFRMAADEIKGRVPLVVGTGSNNTAGSIEMTRAVKNIAGVDAALVVAPYYNKPNQAGMVAHFEAVAAEGVPVVLYNVPGRTVVSMGAASVAALADHPNIISIKEATGDMSLATEIFAKVGDKLTYLSGDDFTTFPFIALGGHGSVSVVSNIAPRLMHDLCAAARAGELDAAREMHHKVFRLAEHCFCEPNPVPTKWMLSEMGRMKPSVRLPMVLPTENTRARLRKAVQEEGLL